MTLTSTGPSGFHLKPLVAVFAATVFAFAAFAVGLWVGNESQPSTPAAVDAATPVATPEVAPSANFAAFEAGKLDDGPLSLPSAAVGESSARAVASAALNANLDAYASGKLDLRARCRESESLRSQRSGPHVRQLGRVRRRQARRRPGHPDRHRRRVERQLRAVGRRQVRPGIRRSAPRRDLRAGP